MTTRETDQTDAADLLARYVELHNEAALGGDDDTAEVLADDVEFAIEGQALSPLRKAAMLDSFRKSELMLWKIGALSDDQAFAEYAWRKNPRLGGHIRLHCADGRIRKLVLRPGYSRVFATLSLRPPPLMDDGGPNAFAGD